MKIKVKQSTLLKQLELVSRVSTKHVTLPVLQCVLFAVKDGEVHIKATNLELAIDVELKDVEVIADGIIAVPTQTLLQTVQYVTHKDVELSVNQDGLLEIESGKTKTTIKPISHEEFPTIPKIQTTSVTINKDQFSLGVKTTAFAASQSSIKPELGSIYIYQKKEHSLTFVTTDSFRLMEKTVSQKNIVLDQSILIPYKNAVEVARICDLLDVDPEMMVTDNQCSFTFSSGVYVTTRLTTGTFPDYTAIIPKEYTTHSTVLKQDLVNILKKTNIFLNKYQQVVVDVLDTTINFSAQNNDVGAITDSISTQTEGEELRLSFNQQYILDPLQYIQDDSVVMHFAGIGRPLVFEGVSDKSFRYLVMPMNK